MFSAVFTNIIPGSWPFLVSVQQIFLGLRWNHVCGGFIIHRNLIVTAAHCFDGVKLSHSNLKRNWLVLAGTNNNTLPSYRKDVNPDAWKSIHAHEIEKVLKHGGYVRRDIRNQNFLVNDIAIIWLKKPLALSDAIKIGKLENPGHHPKAGTICRIAGWGSRTNNALDPDPVRGTNILHEASVPIKDLHQCRNNYFVTLLNGTGVESLKDIEAYKQQKEISSLILYDLHVCAGTGERAGCVVGKLIYLHITYIS